MGMTQQLRQILGELYPADGVLPPGNATDPHIRHSTHIAILHGYSLHRSSPLGHVIVEGIMKKMDVILTAIPEVNYAMVWTSDVHVNLNLEVQLLSVQKEDCFTIAQVAVVLPCSFMCKCNKRLMVDP